MLELKRADIGFGRVVIDDRGVERHAPLSKNALSWDEIRDYRLTVELVGEWPALVYQVTDLAQLIDLVNGYRGKHTCQLGIELIGASDTVEFNWRFRDVELAIARILERIRGRTLADARSTLQATGKASFGPLGLTADAVHWDGHEPLPRADVEAVELFNNSPIDLRVMAHGKAWPHARAQTKDIPNLLAALEIAASLGYRVRGRELLEALIVAPPAATVVGT